VPEAQPAYRVTAHLLPARSSCWTALLQAGCKQASCPFPHVYASLPPACLQALLGSRQMAYETVTGEGLEPNEANFVGWKRVWQALENGRLTLVDQVRGAAGRWLWASAAGLGGRGCRNPKPPGQPSETSALPGLHAVAV
jgi:hypothetical protein